jgi:uncharacterized protein (TIGR02145 family)
MKIIKLFTISFMLFIFNSVNAQTNLGNTFSGSGNPATLLCPQTRAAFTDEKVNHLIVEILNVSNLKNRFIIMPCSGISNCQAIYYEGKPYILYNAAFLNEIKGLSFSEKDLVVSERNWESITILAHELGHHFNNHLNNPPPGATAQQLELEADEFAGSTIYMLGGSLIQAQSAFKNESVSESYTHPGRMARLGAVAKGWNEASLRFVNKGGKRTEPAIVTKNYNSVKIGAQEWMTKNLDVDRFRNGDLIPEVQGEDAFRQAGIRGQPAWCYYNSDPLNGEKFGKLYNWFAVNDPRGLAPQGWHIPSLEELKVLVKFAGGKDIAGQKLKSKFDWISNDAKFPLKRGIDFFGFSALPGSSHNSFGFIDGSLNGSGFWWTSTKEVYDNIITDAYFWSIYAEANYININATSVFSGKSIRCIKD